MDAWEIVGIAAGGAAIASAITGMEVLRRHRESTTDFLLAIDRPTKGTFVLRNMTPQRLELMIEPPDVTRVDGLPERTTLRSGEGLSFQMVESAGHRIPPHLVMRIRRRRSWSKEIVIPIPPA